MTLKKTDGTQSVDEYIAIYGFCHWQAQEVIKARNEAISRGDYRKDMNVDLAEDPPRVKWYGGPGAYLELNGRRVYFNSKRDLIKVRDELSKFIESYEDDFSRGLDDKVSDMDVL
jgi:hypothetical protein